MFNLSNKKIIILGSEGNLGAQLVHVFGNDYRLFLFDKNSLDVLDYENLKLKIGEIKPDIVINAVAYNAVDNCEDDEKEFQLAKKLNGELLGILADICLENDTLLVHYSSDYVFGGDGKKEYKEKDAYCPVNKYGETKMIGEKEIVNRVEKGLKYYIIRTSKLFGPVGSSAVSKPSFFDIMLKLGREKDELSVVDEELSCFTYTPDLAKATFELIQNNEKSGIYHLINEGRCTWYESVIELFKITKNNGRQTHSIKINPVKADAFPRPAKRAAFSVLKNTKVEKLRNYKEALKEYLSQKG